jgi:hypothetical protein
MNPSPQPTGDATAAAVELPPSLRRRGPEAITLEDERGNPVRLGRAGFHMRTGRRYKLRIRPQSEERTDRLRGVHLSPGKAYDVVNPPALVPGSEGEEYVAIIQVHTRWLLRLPGPTGDSITFSLEYERWEPLSMVLPVVVWPTFRSQFFWVFGLVLIFVGRRILSIGEKEKAALTTALLEALSERALWLEVVFCTAGGCLLLAFATWAWITVGLRSD